MKINHEKETWCIANFYKWHWTKRMTVHKENFQFLSEKGCRLHLTDLKAILEFSYINDNAPLKYRVKKIVKWNLKVSILPLYNNIRKLMSVFHASVLLFWSWIAPKHCHSSCESITHVSVHLLTMKINQWAHQHFWN